MLPDDRSYVTVGGFFAMEIIAYICQFFVVALYIGCIFFVFKSLAFIRRSRTLYMSYCLALHVKASPGPLHHWILVHYLHEIRSTHLVDPGNFIVREISTNLQGHS